MINRYYELTVEKNGEKTNLKFVDEKLLDDVRHHLRREGFTATREPYGLAICRSFDSAVEAARMACNDL